jgi:serine/threonine protein kinase
MLAQGTRIGDYEIVRLAAVGAMSEVYEGRDLGSGQPVAVKLLHESWSLAVDLCARFLNEASTLQRLRHPGIISVLTWGRLDQDRPFMVLEWLSPTLADVLARVDAPLAAPMAARIAAQIADALVALHGSGIVHRDIKPANVLLSQDDLTIARAKLSDLGLAKLLPTDEEGRLAASPISTGGDALLGTWDYMSPEQWIKSKDAGPSADVYSLGVLLFQMLAGRLPFAAEDQRELMCLHLFEQPPWHLLDARASSVPGILRSGLVEMLGKKPSNRPMMHEVARWLSELS